MRMIMKILTTIITIIILTGAPLLGVYLAGDTPANYLVFPPVTTTPDIEHAPFMITAFFLLLFIILITIAPFLIKVFNSGNAGQAGKESPDRFPRWGRAGLMILVLGWILAWTRFTWLGNLQAHTFTLPWIGYIITVNALTVKRSGRSLLTHEPLYFAGLFIFSAIFWWYFEFLNQFTQNWYYVNIGNLGRFETFWYATLPFATVLPAVLSTFYLLRTFKGLYRGLDHFFSIPVKKPGLTAFFAAITATAALTVTPIIPDYTFPMLWLAPLVILASAMVMTGVPTFLNGITKGDWSTVYLLALSALVCGFFWEMWNYFSYTRWEYSIPFVDRFNIFEMPVLGYAGYLPFGLQCGLMAMLVKHLIYPASRKNRLIV